MSQLEKQIGVRMNARMVRGLAILTEREEITSGSHGVREAVKDLLIKYGVWGEAAIKEAKPQK